MSHSILWRTAIPVRYISHLEVAGVQRASQFNGPYPRQYALNLLARDLEELESPSLAFKILSEQLSSMLQELGLPPDLMHKRDLHHQLSLDILDAKEGTAYWRVLCDAAAPMLEIFWNALAQNDQQHFMQNWSSLWYSYVHAMPYENACRLQNLLQEKKLEIFDFRGAKNSILGFIVSGGERDVHADYLIEATGQELEASHIQDPLVAFLLATKVLERHYSSGFSVDQYTLESTKTKGIYVIGSLTSGVHFYTNGIDSNVRDGRPEKPLAHVAIIKPTASVSWTDCVSAIVPGMVEKSLIPFVYLSNKSSPTAHLHRG